MVCSVWGYTHVCECVMCVCAQLWVCTCGRVCAVVWCGTLPHAGKTTPHRDLSGRVCAGRPLAWRPEQVSASRCCCGRAERTPWRCGSRAWMSLGLTPMELLK